VPKDPTYVGLDAHKDSISAAMLLPGEARMIEWQVSHDEVEVSRRRSSTVVRGR